MREHNRAGTIVNKLARLVKDTTTNTLLTTSFVLGIGMVSMLYKCMRRRLLGYKTKRSSWQPVSTGTHTNKMY